jgi:hypothetical protein
MTWFAPRVSDVIGYVCLADPAIDWEGMGVPHHITRPIVLTDELRVILQTARIQEIEQQTKDFKAWSAWVDNYQKDPGSGWKLLKFKDGLEPITWQLHPPDPYLFAMKTAEWVDRENLQPGIDITTVGRVEYNWELARMVLQAVTSPAGETIALEFEGAETAKVVTLACMRKHFSYGVIKELAEQASLLAQSDKEVAGNS